MKYRDRYLRRARAKAIDVVLKRQASIIADRAACMELLREAPERAAVVALVYDPENRIEPIKYRAIDDQGVLGSWKVNFIANALCRETLDSAMNFLTYVEVEHDSDDDA
jgi:hypothetical protein